VVVVNYDRPLKQQEFNQLRERLKALQEKKAASHSDKAPSAAGRTHPAWTPADMMAVAEIREKLAQSQKRMVNPAIAEIVTVRITISSNAEPGERELRLGGPLSMSQPLAFCVGELPEFNKPDAPAVSESPEPSRTKNDNVPRAAAPVESRIRLPCVVNGQIQPGGVDRYRFAAREGQRLVIIADARELIPYLADAVPGWFQAVLTLYDNRGREVAYADHFQFHPDPALFYEVPKDGEFVLQIRDSIYRGREDFVYRIMAGELPFVTGIFPLGGLAGAQTIVKLMGWNLPDAAMTEDDRDFAPGVYPLSVHTEKYVSNRHPFAVDTLPECFSQNSNHSQATAQLVTLPVIVNGRIETPGQWDVFRFQGQAGEEIVAEVMARRLDSPLDSVIKLTDAAGQQLAFNDDYEDKGAGLQTQYADSYLRVTLPATGTYYVHLGDAQHQSGPEYAYRLRLSPPRPDFALRLVPSSLSLRGGMAAPFTVYALRRDGLSNEITLALKDAPHGFTLGGSVVPANQNEARFTLMARKQSDEKVFQLSVQGRALIRGHEVTHPAVPAEDMMQAFAYRHLVPSKELEVSLADRSQMRNTLKILDPTPIKIPAGGTVEVRVSSPGRVATNNFHLELNDPPNGVSIANVAAGDGETTIVLHSDAAKIKPGVTGNLIFNIIADRKQPAAVPGKSRGNQQRIALGVLPAIPFEIVAP
jgi:hypothetical protein